MKKIYLIDGNSFIYRMFYGIPEFATKDGKIVNAIFGMAKFFVSQLTKEKPDYLIFIKDAKGTNFRHDLYSEYKATRDRMPDNLREQIGGIEEMIKMMGIDIIEIEGYEADDVIGTLAVQLGKDKDYEIDILTGDKDLYSLVSDNVRIYDTMKRKKFGLDETQEKFGVKSNMIIDYLAIVGDKADNIPGIEGFGPKKAIELINTLGGVDDIYNTVKEVEIGNKKYDELTKNIQSCFKGKTFEKLINSKENAILSKKLATIALDVDLGDFDINDYIFDTSKILNNNIIDFFKELEFNSLIGEENKELTKWGDLGLKVNIVGNKLELDNLSSLIDNYNEIVFDTETTGLDIMTAHLVGISIYLDDNNIFYINRLHNGNKVSDNDLKNFINKLFNSNKTLIAHNIKYDLEIIELFLENNNLEIDNDNNFNQMSLL